MSEAAIQRQRILREFVSEHVGNCVTYLVEYVLQKSMEGDTDAPLDWEDVRNSTTFDNLTLESLLQTAVDLERNGVDFSWSIPDEVEDNWTEEEHEAFEEILADSYPAEALQTFLEHFPNAEIDEDALANACASEYNPEIYEWWVVDSFFARQLQQRGEVVLDGQFWGRQCTGQAIFLDCIIGEIYDALQARVGGA